MNRNLTDEDINAICIRLTELSGLTAEEHRAHHIAFGVFMADQARKAAFRERVKEQIGGWFIISVLAAIGYAAWHGFVWAVERGHQ